jgi:hypothetical protein
MIFISMQQQKCNLLLIIVFIILSTIALTGRSSAVEISCESAQTTVQRRRAYTYFILHIYRYGSGGGGEGEDSSGKIDKEDIMIFISMPQQKCSNLLLIIVFIILSTIALTGRSSAVEISCDGTSQLSRVRRAYILVILHIYRYGMLRRRRRRGRQFGKKRQKIL